MPVHSCTLAAVSSLLLLGVPLDAHAATFYLSPGGSDTGGTGTRQAPWKTLQHATGKMPDDGSTLVLLDGLYDGSQAVARQFNKMCTVKAEHAYQARLRGGPRQNRALTCYQAANVTFQGLEIAGSGATQGEYLVHISTPKTHHLVFEDCIVHDCYNNDMIKINDATHHILFRNCVFFNQTDGEGFQHFDINTCTDVRLEDSIFFNDYAGSGRRSANRSQGFIVAKNSGSTPERHAADRPAAEHLPQLGRQAGHGLHPAGRGRQAVRRGPAGADRKQPVPPQLARADLGHAAVQGRPEGHHFPGEYRGRATRR